MENLELLIDLHKHAARQGPGGVEETIKAIELAMLDRGSELKIADIGCGTGASAIVLAKQLNAQVTAVDFLQDFIEVLIENTEKEKIANRVHPLVCSMEELPFSDREYDVIWSEGAIYNMGFERGVKEWGRFLKPGGMLVVSEITWSTNKRPHELQAYWEEAYPEIDTASSKIKIIEDNGYSLSSYFLLPEHCWLENYYRPMQSRFNDFLKRNGASEEARTIVFNEEKEISLYETYKQYYSYGVYIAKKLHG